MVEKRKATTRAKGEAPAKRRASTQIIEEAKDTPVPEPLTIKVVSNSLPTKISDGKPLPTVGEPQPPDLSNKDYQSIMQSGVLAESLKRSRNKWLSEGIFERYWTKPSKSKHVVAPENNPDRNTMMIVGHCRLTIEPHVFDARLYIVKDPAATSQPLKQSFPAHRPIMQYGPPNGIVVTPPLPHRSTPRNDNVHQSPYQPTPPPPPPPLRQPKGSPAQDYQSRVLPPPHSSPNLQSHKTAPSPHNHASPQPHHHVSSDHRAAGAGTPNGPPNPKTNGTTEHPTLEGDWSPNMTDAKPDPVIHMLAKKASSDPQLTSLMKTVASGTASETQLKIFQQHIDELSAILAKQKEDKAKMVKSPVPPNPHSLPAAPNPTPPPGAPPAHSTLPTRDGAANAAGPASTYSTTNAVPLRPHHSTSSPAQPQAYYQSTPPLAKAKSTASPRGPGTHDVAVEFERNGDRFLFPRYSILEYLPNCNVVIASFLIVRRGSTLSTTANGNSKKQVASKTKGDASLDSKASSTPNLKAEPPADDDADVNPPVYDPALDYYQPVTVRFSSDEAKVLSVLQQAVAPPEEVRRYMDDVMDKMTRAEYVYLAMRLPKPDEGDGEEGDGAADDGILGGKEIAEGLGRGKKVVRIE
ncbi:MAG: hypothetical protein M1822_000754 [Bathelium mastoideum]|nr:MAG: hypothetical protein M1822_000754 [Bathelium mastoideum]